MIEYLSELSLWFWFAFGLIMLIGECIAPLGYLLWLGISALLVAGITAVGGLPWQAHWVIFGCLSVLSAVGVWLNQAGTNEEAGNNLNNPSDNLIGKVATVESDTKAGKFRLSLGHSCYGAVTHQDIKAGTAVEVISVDGIIVTVQPK
ncbi:hypothetical protein A6E01_20260 (plasmid) [Vibrio breoganii]|uniref:NfeD-like C-terminal domain-containing protein n=1 Tax=Vibrio breoganii TaxID=553239 RepID=A0AAN0XZQ0_9VIBR|nr:NfeD family protein [Vibrio breoganii]ANO35548.1 hypothetical protein A6E01_20260 [Vibrio breoganii]PML15811.1 hypothetical protein BCT84_07355 [Vibrio breoganii]